jgi:OCT family organic cation transporter-like MFS transporter 18
MLMSSTDSTSSEMSVPDKWLKSITLAIIYINVALYATCFQIQRPLEPFLVERISSNKASSGGMDYAKLQSFFSIMQTLGSLITGTFLDRFGAKGGFIISFLASAASYYLLSISSTMEILYLSKVPTIFQVRSRLCTRILL